jgi:hypothetical protein
MGWVNWHSLEYGAGEGAVEVIVNVATTGSYSFRVGQDRHGREAGSL